MDFTQITYKNLLQELQKKYAHFFTFSEWSTQSTIQPFNRSTIFLRHDVDRKPENALDMAVIEDELGVKASYYFRIVKESNNPEIIEKIAKLGHEIGYHYEDLALANGDYLKAIQSFEKNLEYFRQFYPIKTICMHGSPLSKWDNRKLWEKYDYRKYGIIAEPYFDLDFDDIFYITDAGRSWNDERTSVRDRVNSKFTIKIDSTDDLLKLLMENKLPPKIMFNIHPHNWANNLFEWSQILFWQTIKNFVKRNLNSWR